MDLYYTLILTNLKTTYRIILMILFCFHNSNALGLVWLVIHPIEIFAQLVGKILISLSLLWPTLIKLKRANMPAIVVLQQMAAQLYNVKLVIQVVLLVQKMAQLEMWKIVYNAHKLILSVFLQHLSVYRLVI